MTGTITRVWLALFVVVIFVGGVGAGVLANNWMTRPRGAPMMRDGRGPGPGRGPDDGFRGPGRSPSPERLVGRLADELELTGEQREQLDTLFDEQRDRMRSFNDDVRERFRSAQQEIRAGINEILTPEQRERFDELTVDLRRSRGNFRRGRQRRGPDR